MAADSQPYERGQRNPAARLSGPSAFRRFMLASMASLSYPGTKAEQLLLAPQELRTADPSFATELYNGHFGLAGRLAEVEAGSPFEIEPPSEAWARELYGFGWLRHLRAAGSELSREQARVLVNDFIALKRTIPPLAWEPEIVGRRVISWLSNSVLILDSGDPEGYETFLRSLTSQLRYLSASYRKGPDGVPRLVALMALIYAGLCIAEQQAVVDRYSRPFCKELERQILPDGGHISRNPEALVELLLDLLPLRHCFVARDRTPPKELTDAIDRIMPMLRFFRTGDGTLARFNGAGPTPTDALATVLAYDDVEGKPVRGATNSGYVRLECESTLIVVDIGAAPPPSLSANAHAGFLSFELSSGNCPIIVNCGAPPPHHDEWRPFSRSTPAHSTLSFEETSSADFSTTGANGSSIAPDAPLTGPVNAQASFSDQSDNLRVKGSHDGYMADFGVSHARQFLIAPDGLLISAEDKLTAPVGLKSPDGAMIGGEYAIRFHLHPSVKAELEGGGASALLTLPNGEKWRIGSNAPETRIEESFYLADARGPQASSQVVLGGMMGEAFEVRIVWNIERVTDGAGGHPLVDPNDTAPDAV
ncbi:MAG TPA: heparinase II/III family protein [Methyloceanibacter sp.]|nr:heparinase II/III family protein [Methyloceanibacter sp.]